MVTLYLAGAECPDMREDLRVREAAAGLARDAWLSAYPAGGRFATSYHGAGFEVLASALWTDGWTKLALRRVA